MDLATLIGLLLGSLLVLAAILLGDSPLIFINASSLMIVFGGTLGVTFIKNPMSRVFGTVGVVKKAFFSKVPQIDQLIDQLIELSRKARRESLLSLEKVAIEDEFLNNSVRLAVDGMEPAAIRTVLETEINYLVQRHKVGQDLLEGMSTSALAFGMIGTLIGLVQMLAGLSDPSTIGPSMAVAILTTLYGALVANLFAAPLAEKLKNRSRDEVNARMVILRGVLSIAEGDHPASVEQKLTVYLRPNERKSAEDKKAA